MPVVSTGLSVSAFTLNAANNHLGDLKLWEVDIGGTAVKRQGIASTNAYTQVTKRSGTFNFEMVYNNSGPAFTNLDVSVWTPMGTSLIGTLKSGSFDMKLPTADGSGISDVFTYANYTGARDCSCDAEMYVASGAHALMTAAISTTQANWTTATLLLTLGTSLVLSYPMTLVNASHRGDFEGLQMLKTHFEQRGAAVSTASGTTFIGVAFAGDGLITIGEATGSGTYTMTDALIESCKLTFMDGAITMISGTLKVRGAPTYA